MEAILTGVIANIIYGIVTKSSKVFFNLNGLESNIKAAYNKALEKWTPNPTLRAQKEVFLRQNLHYLADYLFDPDFEAKVKSEVKSFLEVFHAELLEDPNKYIAIQEINRSYSAKNITALKEGQKDIALMLEEIKTQISSISTVSTPIESKSIPDPLELLKNYEEPTNYIARKLTHVILTSILKTRTRKPTIWIRLKYYSKNSEPPKKR